MPKAIQILTTLEYLGPYPKTGTYFGLVLQVGVAEAATPQDVQVTAAMEQLFEPWKWKSLDIQLWRYLVAGNDPRAATPSHDRPVSVNLRSYSLDASIAAKLESDCRAAIPDHLAWIDAGAENGISAADPTTKSYPWPAHLAQVALYPYPIPHLLNLSFLLSVQDPDFVIPKSGYAYFATVAFQANVAGNLKTYTPQVKSDSQLNTDASRLTTKYDDHNLVACTQPLCSFTPVASVLSNASTSAEATDWQAHLAAGCGDLFDLSSRLIGAVRNDCLQAVSADKCSNLQKAVAADFDTFILAVLTAERDAVSYGSQRGPDGSSLLSRLCTLWVSEGKPGGTDQQQRRIFAEQFPQAVKRQRAMDALDWAAFQDGWLLTLKQNSAFARNSLLPLAATPPASAKRFNKKSQIRKGDVVIFHGRLFTALGDLGASASSPGTLGSAPDWSLFDSSIRIYDARPSATYNVGDRVLLLDSVYQAAQSGGSTAFGPPPSANWTLLAPDRLVVDVSHLSDRLVALEHLHLQLTQSDSLSQILLAQWQTVVDAYDPADPPTGVSTPLPKTAYSQMFQSFRNSAMANMDVLNVRGLLLQGNLEGSWDQITATAKIKENLIRNVPTALDTRLGALLAGITNGAVVGFASPLREAVAASSVRLVNKTLLPSAIQTAAAKLPATVQPTRTTEGLSILVDELNSASSLASDKHDSLRQMSGLCVLMRETTENIWRCLNAANPVPAVTGLADPIVVPVPQHIQNNLRRSILTYNNQPLMGESPAHRFGQNILAADGKVRERLVSFQHPSVTKRLDADSLPQWKMPGLAFNRKYDVLIGRVSNAGALPPSFSSPRLGPAVLDFASVNKNNPPPSLSKVPYGRTVPVSDLRFGPSAGSLDKIALPPVPDDVHPRAREAGMFDKPGSDAKATPLVMLTSYPVPNQTSAFELTIYKPTTDMLTWDRWMAALDKSKPGTSSDLRKLRTQVWERYNVLARRESSKNLLSLDDPAVGTLTITIEGLDGLTGAASTDTKPWDPILTKPDPNPPADRVLTPASPLSLKINAVGSGSTDRVFDPTTWTLNLKPGTVARITLTPTIAPSDQGLFAPGIQVASLEPYQFVVETASKDFPNADELRDAFQVLAPTASTDPRVHLLLTPQNAANVKGADVRTQVWRWDGRPSTQYPFSAKLNPPDPDLLAWELETFATRLASDASVRPMTRGDVKKGVTAFESYDDRTTEPSATYYRASITAYNRYGSLVPKENRSVSTLDQFASVPGAFGGWTRGFVRANLPASYKPPKPAVKFIVPLTSSTNGSQDRAASVLVVLQGPWYSIGGLAEDFRAQILDSSPTNDAEKVKEAGPDPITFEGYRKELPTDYLEYDDLYPLGRDPLIHGPIGHTFDSSDINPLWISTSFVLDPPRIKPENVAAQEGTFAQMQFARLIHGKGVLGSPASDLTSDFTDPVWIQFLPGSFTPFASHVEGLSLEVDGNTATVTQNGTPITLHHPLNSGISGEHYIYALLVTEEVSDLLGRQGQERFRDVLLNPAIGVPGSSSTTARWTTSLTGSAFMGRILVIQRQANSTACTTKKAGCVLSNASDLWKEMFPSDVPEQQDVISRIVSVSPPVYSSGTRVTCADAKRETK